MVARKNTLEGSGVERILSHLSAQLHGFPSVRRALLVGSRARNDHHERSDVELAISMPGATVADWDRLRAVVEQCPTLLRVRVIRLDTCSPDLQLRAESEGLLFFHPLDRPWAEFRASLDALGRCLADDLSSPTVRDGLLFRFARTADLFHRLLRALLTSQGLTERGYKDALTQAYQQRWVTDEERWLSFLQARFWTDRAFDEERISPLVEKMPRHYSLLLATASNLRGLFDLS
jgi:uncharacterized protein